MENIGAIIFDFDGVLAESNQAKADAFDALFALYPAYAQAMRKYHRENYSSSRLVKFEYYVTGLMGYPGDHKMLQTMAGQFSDIVKQRVIASPDVPGARPFLEEFSKRVPLYISSVTPQRELREILQARGIDQYFVEAFGDPPVKKVAAINTVLTREGLSPAQVIFIGDSPSDYQVALRTGVRFYARDSGFGFDHDDIALYDDLYEIADEIRRRMKG